MTKLNWQKNNWLHWRVLDAFNGRLLPTRQTKTPLPTTQIQNTSILQQYVSSNPSLQCWIPSQTNLGDKQWPSGQTQNPRGQSKLPVNIRVNVIFA